MGGGGQVVGVMGEIRADAVPMALLLAMGLGLGQQGSTVAIKGPDGAPMQGHADGPKGKAAAQQQPSR
eukprot:gene9544-8533_t